MTITEFVSERAVVMEGKALGIRLTRFYSLEPINDKTRVTVSGQVSGILAWLARRSGQAISEEIVEGLKKKIEK